MSVKFLAFTDLHHAPELWGHDAPAFLDAILQRAQAENADFIVHTGDFLHNPARNSALAQVYRNAPIPTYGALGNHDTDHMPMDAVLQMHGMEKNYYFFDRQGYRVVILDPNYSTVDGEAVHYGPNVRRSHGKGEIPPDQLEWLKNTLAESPFPCILCSHQSIERSDGIRNRDQVWSVICEANRRREHSVIMCINGHYHTDWCSVVNGVCCLDLNSVSYYWCDVENALYPPEQYKRLPLTAHCLFYQNPLSAVITVTDAWQILINGADGTFTVPIPEEERLRLDQRRLSLGRSSSPRIRSYTVDLQTETVTVSPEQ